MSYYLIYGVAGHEAYYWELIKYRPCKLAIETILMICNKYYTKDIGIHIGKFLWKMKRRFVRIGFKPSFRPLYPDDCGDELYMGITVNNTGNIYVDMRTETDKLKIVSGVIKNKNLLNTISKHYWDLSLKYYAVLSPLCCTSQYVSGNIMYGYGYNGGYYMDTFSFKVNNVKLSSVSVAHCIKTKYHSNFVGIVLGKVIGTEDETDSNANAKALRKTYYKDDRLPSKIDILIGLNKKYKQTQENDAKEIMEYRIKYNVDNNASNEKQLAISIEERAIKIENFAKNPVIAFVPTLCYCCEDPYNF